MANVIHDYGYRQHPHQVQLSDGELVWLEYQIKHVLRAEAAMGTLVRNEIIRALDEYRENMEEE